MTLDQREPQSTELDSWSDVHSIGVHRFPSVEIEVAEIRRNLRGIVALNFLLENLDLVIVRAAFLHLLNDFLQVAWSKRDKPLSESR